MARSEDDRETHFKVLNNTIKDCYMGKFNLNIEWISSPEERFRARQPSAGGVERLVESYIKYGTVSEHCEVVLFWDEEKSLPNHDELQNFMTSSQLVSEAVRRKRGFFAIVGDHSQLAVHRCHRRYMKNSLWQTLECKVYVVHDTPEMCASIKSWGIIDNMKGAVRTKMSFQDMVLSLHVDYIGLQDQKELVDFPTILKSLKAARALDLAMPTNTFGQYWNLASRTGAVWDAIEKLLTGQVHVQQGKPKFKPLKSPAPLIFMGGIDDDVLTPMLNDVVDGVISLKQFTLDCKKVKARMRIQSEILRFEAIDMTDWDSAEKKYPTACSATFIERWAQVAVSKQMLRKDSLPVSFSMTYPHGSLWTQTCKRWTDPRSRSN